MAEPPEATPAPEIIDPRSPPNSSGTQIGPLDAAAAMITGRKNNRLGELKDARETYAREIAQIITYTFAICSVLILFGLYRILVYHPGEAETLIVKTGSPALKEVGSFLSSVFGPLLAFVLGYYFGERKPKD